MPLDKIKVALVGCGRISKNHFNAIHSFKNDLELVAVCDNNDERLHAAMEEQKVEAYSDLDKMLASQDIDLLVCCTPSGLHPKHAMMGARSGCHVITEKPMATRLSYAIDMVKVCDDENVKLFVVKQNRLNPTLQKVKEAIDAGRFGKMYMVTSNVFWTRPDAYYKQDAWRGTWELDGGAYMNQASHYLDLLQWLIGPVDSVQAMMGTLARDIEAEDTGVLNLKWRKGTIGSMAVTMLTYPKNLEGSITLLGEKGTVKIGGVAVNDILHWEFDDASIDDEKILEASYQTDSVYGVGHPLYYKNVIDVLKGEAKPITDGRSGLKSLELLIAAYQAARDNNTVSLPLTL
jgi:UDP-N-acetyl-2-amino-2-deoxyglucuronate dehydrogenase